MVVHEHNDLWELYIQIQQGKAVNQTVDSLQIKNNYPQLSQKCVSTPKDTASGDIQGVPRTKEPLLSQKRPANRSPTLPGAGLHGQDDFRTEKLRASTGCRGGEQG